jgi:hypothetical protein
MRPPVFDHETHKIRENEKYVSFGFIRVVRGSRLLMVALAMLMLVPLGKLSAETVVPKSLSVILLGGQSNADGRASSDDIQVIPSDLQQSQTNVLFYWHTHGTPKNADGTLGTLGVLHPGGTQMPKNGFGPEISLGYYLSRVVEQSPGDRLVIIKYAKGGSNLAVDWKAGGDSSMNGDGVHYRIFQQVVKDGLVKLHQAYPDYAIKIAGMVWVQGESDIDGGSAMANAYATNLTGFIQDMRQTFGNDLPFFFSRISAQQKFYSAAKPPKYETYLILRKQQADVATTVPNVRLIDTDFSRFTVKKDFLHFDAAGQSALGKAFADRISEIVFPHSEK